MTLKSNILSFLNNNQFRSRYDSNDGGKTNLTAHVLRANADARRDARGRQRGSHATRKLQEHDQFSQLISENSFNLGSTQ